MKLSRILVCAGVAATLAGGLCAQVDGRTKAQLVRKKFKSTNTQKEREYFLYVPVGYESEKGKRWPVILFLHGFGERGDGLSDLEKVLKHGPLMEAWVKGRDLPFLIISPQMPGFEMPAPAKPETPRAPAAPKAGPPPLTRWGDEGPPSGWWMSEKDLLNMVDEVLREYRADPGRVYLTGLSYGGFGTWHMAAAHPNRWTAVAPMCGAGNPKTLARIAEAKVPIWIFTGGRDRLVRPEWVLASAAELEKAGHPSVRFTVHEDLGHDVWTRVYEGLDLYNWFLAHRRE